jgi:hypothetical protein
MNERIKELAEQALFESDFDDEQNLKIAMDIFAELIVRECIDTLDQMPAYQKNENDREIERNTISDCIRAIEQRFGI